jgi:hypothetical protein
MSEKLLHTLGSTLRANRGASSCLAVSRGFKRAQPSSIALYSAIAASLLTSLAVQKSRWSHNIARSEGISIEENMAGKDGEDSSQEQLEDMLMSFVFPERNVPKDFNFSRFIKLIFVDEEQKRACVKHVAQLVDKHMDDFDFMYSLTSDKRSWKEKDLENKTSERVNPYVIGVRIQVDYKESIEMVDVSKLEQIEHLIKETLKPSAPVPLPGTGKDGVEEIVYDNFIEKASLC